MGGTLGKSNVLLGVISVVQNPALLVVSVSASGLEATADVLLGLHNGEHDEHHEDSDAPLVSIHGSHLEHKPVKARNVGDEDLEEGNNGDGVPGKRVTLEDTGMDGGVVRETSGHGDGDGTEIKGVNGLRVKDTLVVILAVNESITRKTSLTALSALGPEDRTNGDSGKGGSSKDNAEEEVASDEGRTHRGRCL